MTFFVGLAGISVELFSLVIFEPVLQAEIFEGLQTTNTHQEANKLKRKGWRKTANFFCIYCSN